LNAYTWQFPALDVYLSYQGLADAVYQVHWRLTGDDGLGHLWTAYGSQMIGSIDITNFTPFAQLSALIVQGWVETQMGTDLYDLKAYIDKMIAQLASPATATMNSPW
jgi:hypothetical protein